MGITVNQSVSQIDKQAKICQSDQQLSQSLIHNYNNHDDNNEPIYTAQNVSEGTILNAHTRSHTQAPAHTSALIMHKFNKR